MWETLQSSRPPAGGAVDREVPHGRHLEETPKAALVGGDRQQSPAHHDGITHLRVERHRIGLGLQTSPGTGDELAGERPPPRALFPRLQRAAAL